jgi:hypothetical protein
MKLLLITIFTIFSVNANAVEFYQCIDEKGQKHLTNLPALSLDSNCKLKVNRYAFIINQDFSNLVNRLKVYVELDETPQQDEDSLNINTMDDSLLPINSVMKPIIDVIDPGKVLNEVNKRKNKLKSILSEDEANNLSNDT